MTHFSRSCLMPPKFQHLPQPLNRKLKVSELPLLQIQIRNLSVDVTMIICVHPHPTIRFRLLPCCFLFTTLLDGNTYYLSLANKEATTTTSKSAASDMMSKHLQRSKRLTSISLRSIDAWAKSASSKERYSRPVSLLAPISLIGGSAVVYSSILNRPSSTLTPVSLVYMLLLSFHYAIQPRLTKKYVKASSHSVALVEEITKTALAASLFAIQPQDVIDADLQTWTLSSSLTVAAVPAVLYAIQGVLQYQSYRYLDAVTYNGLTQTKTLSSAFWCYILLGRRQSPLQLLALGILFCSGILFKGKISKSTDDHFWLGVIPCVGATLLSGLAGALSQKGLQIAGGTGRGAYFYAMEVSLYSALTLLFTKRDWSGLFQNWDIKTMIPVVSKAVGGILTVLVHKHSGSVSKGFSLMFGLVLAGMLQSSLTQKPLPIEQVVGTMLVIFSGWLHFTSGY